MKKSLLIICVAIATSSLMAFGYVNWNNDVNDSKEVSYVKTNRAAYDLANLYSDPIGPEFVYDVDSRFNTTITLTDLQNAKSIIDIVPKKATQSLQSYRKTRVALLDEDEKETIEWGVGDVLNPAQLELFQTADYSTNFYVKADCLNETPALGALQEYDLVYYMSVVPEQEAVYEDGHTALMEYLKENSKSEAIHADMRQVKPGKLNFIVTKDGKVGPVKLESTSGYNSIDKKMTNLIQNMPGSWIPATNGKGEAVDQLLVFSFGSMGC